MAERAESVVKFDLGELVGRVQFRHEYQIGICRTVDESFAYLTTKRRLHCKGACLNAHVVSAYFHFN